MTRIAALVLLAACGAPDDGVTTVASHRLAGPFEEVDHFDGTMVVGEGAQFVAFETPSGWYVDASNPRSYGLCALDHDDGQELRAIQFYTCDVDPPDGTFFKDLVGVVFCDVSRHVCSELVGVSGFDAEWADPWDPKLPGIDHHGDVFELELDHQRFRLGDAEPPFDWLALLGSLGLLLVLVQSAGTLASIGGAGVASSGTASTPASPGAIAVSSVDLPSGVSTSNLRVPTS